MSTVRTVPAKLAKARYRACQMMPYASHAIMSMTPVERRGIRTMCVDKWWRLYYDPEFVEQESADVLVFGVSHELVHLLNKHHKRAGVLVNDQSDEEWLMWNQAADAAVHELLIEAGFSVPEWAVTADKLDLKRSGAVEQYFKELKDRKRQEQEQEPKQGQGEPEPEQEESGQEEGQGGGGESSDSEETGEPGDSGDSSDGESDDGEQEGGEQGDGEQSDGESGQPGGDSGTPSPGESGSCSDGRQRPWELGPPESGNGEGEEAPGLPEWQQDVVVQTVAERVEKSMGSGAGGWQRVIDEHKEPKLDPRKLLTKVVSRAVGALSSGSGRYSYRRPARRPSQGGTIRPRSFQPVPRISLIIDTSGSMGAHEMALGVGLVAKVLNGLRLRDGIRVLTGDEQAAWTEQVFDPRKVELHGGGGTDMGTIVKQEAERRPVERPELIIVVTDGDTPWPKEDVGVPVVACLTYESVWPVPQWMDRVDIY